MYPDPLERRTQTAAIIRTEPVKDCNMDVNKLKIGHKLWSIKHQEYGEIVAIQKKQGWIRLRISGKMKVVKVESLRRRKPVKKKPKNAKIPDFTLFEELGMDDQKRVLKASNYCDLPIRTVMEELGLA